MSWITFVWAANAGICLSLAGMHLLVWAKSRDAWANLAFAIAALAAVGNVVLELKLMRAQTPAQYTEYLRGLHIPLGVLVVSLILFIRLYLGVGRLWLAWLVIGLRVVVMVLNVTLREIQGVQPVSFLGETLAVSIAEPGPLTYLTHLSGFLFLVFAIDSALLGWRRGDRRRASVVGITFGSGIALALVLSVMLGSGTLPIPFTLSFPFLIILAGTAYGLSIDLLRARQLAEDLRNSEERMQMATSDAKIGVWEWDIARDEVWVTDSIRERNRLGASERINLERILEVVHPDDRESVRQKVRDALEGDGSFETEYRAINASGVTQWITARGQLVRASNGKATRLRGVTVDITERKLAEQSLQRSAAFNRQVLASLPHEISILDRDGTIIAVNDAWKTFALANGNGAESVGVNYLDVCRRAAASGEASALDVLEGVQSVLDGSRAFFETEYPCGVANQNRMFLLRVVPLQAPEGGAVVSHVDITQLRLSELETQALRRDLAHMSRVSTMGQLSSALAHELNQPLGAILRNAEAGELFLAHEPPQYEELNGILADIKRDEQRAAAVIDRMRAQLKRHEPTLGPLSVSEILDQVMVLAHAEAQAHHVKVHIDVAAGLPPVRGDRVQLQQVALNLILNALEAMDGTPADQRTLSVTARQLDDRVIEVAISDSGTGIPGGREAGIFEPFHTSKDTGLGMGLAISRAIIESHGGRIWGANNSGAGATFRYTLKVIE